MTAKRPDVGPTVPDDVDRGIGMNAPATRCTCDGLKADPSPEAFREELVRLLPRLRRFAYSLVRDRDGCNDLVQETCARALAKLDLWEADTRLDSWLFRMMQNLWLDRLRGERRSGTAVDVEAIMQLPGEDGRDVTESKLELQRVFSAMAQLKPDHQVIISLVCIEGMAYKEVAKVLDLPIGTVMSRLSRARLELHRSLELEGGSRKRFEVGQNGE